MQTPQRIAVVGTSGSGKTHLAADLAARLGYEHVELDAIHHLPDWTAMERERMRTIVADRVAAERWVVDGNYSNLVQDLVFAAADTVVWLDLPRWVVMRRVLRRTLGRVVFRRELWNGNRERISNLFRREPRENIVLWAWTQHHRYRREYQSKMADDANAHLTWHRVRSTRDVRDWLATLG